MDHQQLKCYIVLLLLNDMTKESQEICERLAKANLTVHLMAGFNLPETCQWDEVCTFGFSAMYCKHSKISYSMTCMVSNT